MTAGRKALFAALTLLVLLVIVEGAARLIWWRLEQRTFMKTTRGAEEILRNDAINFMKQPDGTLGYVLRPGFDRGGTYVSAQGFAQRELVAAEKRAGVLRFAAMGESTTQGHHVDIANYPKYLQRTLKENAGGVSEVEMINGGVSGWLSDQVAMWSERRVAPLRPDLVILYTGWNDFQSYNPFLPTEAQSVFFTAYTGASYLVESSPLKVVSLVSAGYDRRRVKRLEAENEAKGAALVAKKSRDYAAQPSDTYRFYTASLDRIVAAFRGANPQAKIAICTLVGKWPAGPAAAFETKEGSTHWMRKHGLSPQDAAAALQRFNGLIRGYAKARGLILIDAEAAFAGLDRARLQPDFAHFTAEGYELLAEVMYDALRSAGAAQGSANPRLAALQAKYRSK